MSDFVSTKNMVVGIQENGIIRNEKARVIGRLSSDVEFDSEHVLGLNELTEEQHRKLFEDKVFNRHFISTITRTGLGGPCELMPDPKKSLTQAELCTKDDKGNYVREDVSAMWFGYNLALGRS